MTYSAPPATSPSSLPAAPHFELGSILVHPASEYSLDEVAALATDRIMNMERSELINVIRSVRGSHLRPGVYERLSDMDGDTLRRLVFVTRRYCRNQQSFDGAATTPCEFVISWG